VPPAFVPREDALLILPAYHLFGSEPLSLLTPGIAALAPAPYLALHPADAARLGVTVGSMVTVTLGETALTLPVVPREDVPRGAGLLSVGLVETPDALPAWGAVRGGAHA
ncbi:MAG TPA: NADH-quinone oxidoreductase subunit G, partial [Armatimonadota bacterium]|nr:NADH-quinone oxidoreductase subunit G [Armatimonadota bacterium]